MKIPSTLLLSLVIGLGTSSSRESNVLFAAETNPAQAAIGVYDSRVIAYAHFWSDAYQQMLRDLAAAAQAAKAAGQTARVNELESELQRAQATNHLQVFSTAPVDSILAGIKDHLPAIEKEAGVAKLLSKWEETSLRQYPHAKIVDVTDRLLREFRLDEKKMKVAREIRKTKPIPIDKAQEQMRKGKL